MFKNLKNIFTSPKKENEIMNEVTNELQEPVIEETLPEAVTEAAAEPITETTSTESDNTNLVFGSATPEPEAEFNTDDLLNSPLIVGWLSTEEQELLFSALLLFYSPEQSMLDVGCGRADLFGYCNRLFGGTIPYKGIDYNPNILNVAQQKYPGVNVEAVDLLNSESPETFDWVVGSGLFNLNDYEDMESYTKNVIDKMYEKSNFGVAFNLLTGVPDYLSDEDKAQLIVHDPSMWLNHLIEKYTKVICRADYMSGDVTFFIFK